VDADKTYAELGVPGPAPCPPWCAGSHPGSITGPRREAVIFYRASAIGGGALVNGEVVTLGMNWAERFMDGAWQPFRDDDVAVFLQVGTDYIAVDATGPNMAGLAAIARLISPDVEDRLRQARRLLRETSQARQADPAAAR